VQYLPSESPGEEPTMSTTITEQRHSIKLDLLAAVESVEAKR